jgi:hypothetical protein
MAIRADQPGGRPEASDSEDLAVLLDRVAARDEAAFAALYRRTSAKLYGTVARLLSRGHAGDDALQDAYKPAYYGNPNPPFKGDNSGQPYVFINFYDTTGTFDEVTFTENPAVGG